MGCGCKVSKIMKLKRNVTSTFYTECDYCKNLRKEYEEEYHKKLKEAKQTKQKEKE